MAGLSVRQDLLGITSVIRVLGLNAFYYDRILDFFHSSGTNLTLISQKWTNILLSLGLAYQVNGRLIILGDGIKAAKEGRKMPAVKSLHQESESNSKPEYIMGHSCQAISLLMTSASYFFSTPLISRIHEGLVESNRDQRTLMDKMISMINSLQISVPFYFVADAYYSTQKVVRGLLKQGNHLISRVRINAVAYLPLQKAETKGRGRPQLYGKKVKLRDIFKDADKMQSARVNIYGNANTKVLYRSFDLIWKPVGILVRFVFVIHPSKGRAIFLSTDISLDPLKIIEIYALRFKIEVSFKQAIKSIGAYSYRFWMSSMEKIKRKSGDQFVHKKSSQYRDQIKRKINAYHTHIQLCLITQGILQIISMTSTKLVWNYFGSWIRTIRPDILPSEQIVMTSLRNTLPEFLKGSSTDANIEKFIIDKIDLSRRDGQQMVV
jgi:hypothetical protein